MSRWLSGLKNSEVRKKLFLRIVIGLFVLVLALGISAEFTSRPAFCPTCHYMEPFYESWKTSSHNEIACVKCHFPPGLAGTVRGKVEGLVQVVNYLSRSYTRRRPWAEITDQSCLQSGCHETRLLEGRVRFKGVIFDHKQHLGEMRRGKKLRCTSCHSQIVQGDHMVVTETTCFLCHFKKGEEVTTTSFQTLSRCQTCHHWESVPKEEMSRFRYDHTEVVNRKIDCTRCHYQTVVGDGYVPRENCYSCHFDYERLKEYENSDLLHRVHITEHKIECIQCHLQIQHKVQKLHADEELQCSTCHSNTHKEQLFLFTGKPFNGLKGKPNPMFEAGLNCASCHIFHEDLIGQASVKIARPQSCESCHGKGYAHLLELWESSAEKKLAKLEKVVKEIEQSLKNTKFANDSQIQSYLEKAHYGMHLVEVGKAIHNIYYSDKIIEQSYNYLNKVVQLAELPVRVPVEKVSAAVPGECGACHVGIEEIVRPFQGVNFQHKIHIVDQKLKCTTCHSNARRHGEVVLDLQKCNNCHHQTQQLARCEDCHQVAASLYSGNFAGKATPDVMGEAGIACADCHVANQQVRRPELSVCANCHDSEYAEIAKEWQTDVKGLISEIKGLIAQLKANPQLQNSSELQKVEAELQELEKEAASGIHNYNLTMEVLQQDKAQLEKLRMEL